jgi:hypothetical protein
LPFGADQSRGTFNDPHCALGASEHGAQWTLNCDG